MRVEYVLLFIWNLFGGVVSCKKGVISSGRGGLGTIFHCRNSELQYKTFSITEIRTDFDTCNVLSSHLPHSPKSRPGPVTPQAPPTRPRPRQSWPAFLRSVQSQPPFQPPACPPSPARSAPPLSRALLRRRSRRRGFCSTAAPAGAVGAGKGRRGLPFMPRPRVVGEGASGRE